MTVTLLYAIFDDCDVIARSAVITNEGSALLVLERADSLCLELPDDRYDLITLSGDWARERDVIRRRLNPGHQGVSSLRGASSPIRRRPLPRWCIRAASLPRRMWMSSAARA